MSSHHYPETSERVDSFTILYNASPWSEPFEPNMVNAPRPASSRNPSYYIKEYESSKLPQTVSSHMQKLVAEAGLMRDIHEQIDQRECGIGELRIFVPESISPVAVTKVEHVNTKLSELSHVLEETPPTGLHFFGEEILEKGHALTLFTKHLESEFPKIYKHKLEYFEKHAAVVIPHLLLHCLIPAAARWGVDTGPFYGAKIPFEVSVVKSSGHEEFDLAMTKALHGLEFNCWPRGSIIGRAFTLDIRRTDLLEYIVSVSSDSH